MEPQELTKKLDFAGKKIKTAGNAFLFLPVVPLIAYIIISQSEGDADLLQGVSIGATVIYGIFLIVIGAELRSAGQELQKLERKRADNEFEKRMKNQD